MHDELRERIAEYVRRGERLDAIEVELLTPRPGLDDDERAALWLYAWLEGETHLHGHCRRAPSYAHD